MPKGIYERPLGKYPYGPRSLNQKQDADISELYVLGKSQKALAKQYNVGRSQIRKSLRRTGTSTFGRKGQSMEKNPAWKGGRRLSKDGYVQIRIQNQRGYVLEHRFVMEKILGRPLKKEEVVHHKNGILADNRPENLLLFSSNGVHLGCERIGMIPKWTEDGRRRIASRSIPSMAGTHQCPRGTGVRSLRRKLIRKFLRETSDLRDTGPVAVLQLPPAYHHRKKPMKEHETGAHSSTVPELI